MKTIWKRILSFVLAVIMVAGLFPTTAFAAVDSTGRPQDVNNKLILSIYTGNGFPGEPAVYGTSNYKNINSSFAVKSGATFANSANNQLDWTKIQKDIVQGASSGSTSVWGVYDANGTKDYFLPNASIINHDNEIKMIRAVKNCTAKEAEKYEIVWYVIKLQHNPGSGWFSSATTEWHIDGVIKEKEKVSINYYGNGNTSGAAPLGTASHTAGDSYIILDKNTMVKKINGVEVAFLGWSAKSDGTGAEAGFYQPGDVIKPEESISLYAMWDTTTQYTATVNTYLNNMLIDDNEIHGTDRDLFLGTEGHYYQLSRSDEGVYTAKITGNGKFHLYHKNPDGTYNQIGIHQLTIYNQNGSLDVHHYSVTYDANGGSFSETPEKQVYYYGDVVTAIDENPVREGYRFQGWKVGAGTLIESGEEVTASIGEPITLSAQWEKTVNVTVNVTINHVGGNGYDQMETKDDIYMALVSKKDSSSAYLETGDILALNETTHDDFIYSENDNVTTYIATEASFIDMQGGTTEYSVVTSKSGYDTVVTPKQNADGNWIIDVVMTYNPTNFDLEFTVTVDESVPEQYIPDAAIVKVTFWSSDRNQWEVITQQEGANPGVRVDFDSNNRTSIGNYPVWKYESAGKSPYGYRIMITSFVYPDGSIVPAAELIQQDVQWSDNVYTATVDDVTGGKKYGVLDGAFYSDNTEKQEGTLNAVITMDLHDVIFDAQGGKVNEQDTQLVEKQFKIPEFKDYVPVREGGYTFSGWYEDEDFTIPAIIGNDLTEDITLYAKWIDPLTVRGTVTISGTYEQNGETVSVHDIDRANEAVVVLQELRNGTAFDIDSQTISFNNYEDSGSAEYYFTGIPNNNKTYQIHVLVLNYGTIYDNESDNDKDYSANEYAAVFGSDYIADVDAYLEFVPPSYSQLLKVEASAISEDFQPEIVLSEVMYRDTGDNHAFQRISQHDVEPFGVQIELNAGIGEGTESIWKWHTDGTLYEYQMNISKVDNTAFNSDTTPFYVVYDTPAYWDATANAPSGELKATLIPKQYLVSFDLNADTDIVTGMDDYLDNETQNYQTTHTWSFATEITAQPEREGYTFLGWEADVADVYVENKIDADTHQDIVLTAKWEMNIPEILYAVVTTADPIEGGITSGDGNYALGTNVIVSAVANENYQFEGWYENGEKISDHIEYSFEVTGDHMFTAKFINIIKQTYTIQATTNPEDAGSISGVGTYEEGTEIVLSATVNNGYTFVGWFAENGEMITEDKEFSHVVTSDREFKARYNKISTYKNDYAYIFGYTNTIMGAEGTLLRNEAAVMVHRLVKQNNERGDFVYNPSKPSYVDIAGEWFQCGIEYIHYRGGFSAFEGSRAYPYAQITRGEVFRIVALGLGFTDDTTLTNDEYGAILVELGYIVGSGGTGNLNSGSYMTRAAFCTMYNRIIGRTNALLVDKNGNQITAKTYGFTDLDPNAWYYEEMLRATSAYDENGYVDIDKRAIRNVVDDYS